MNELLKWIGIWSNVKGAMDEVKNGGTTERTARITYKKQVYVVEMRIRREAK